MFYSYDILQKRGKFGIIWLAATAPKKLNRREFLAVNVERTSEEIQNILIGNFSQTRQRIRLSLYLSSQLMYGLSVVNRKLCDYLLDELRVMHMKICTYVVPEKGGIDLPVSGRSKLTIDEPPISDASVEFGRLDMMTPVISTPLYYSDMFFSVSTPRSSGLSSGSSHPDGPPSPPDHEGIPLLHVADAEQVTMAEDIIVPSAVIEQPPEMMPGDEAPVDYADLFSQPSFYPSIPHAPISDDEVLPRVEQPEPVTEEDNIPDILETTPIVPTTPAEPGRPEKIPAPQELDETMDEDAEHERRQIRRQRISLPDESSDFILEDIAAPPRKRKRRHLIVDDVISFSGEDIMNNLHTADDLMSAEPPIAILQDLGFSFNRFESRLLSKGSSKFWRPLRTIPEPKDPAKYWDFSRREEFDDLGTVQDIQKEALAESVETPAEIERLREQESSASGLSKIDFSKTDSLSQRAPDLSGTRDEAVGISDATKEHVPSLLMQPILEETELLPIPTDVPDVQLEQLIEPLAEIELPQPDILTPVQKPVSKPECMVSPIRTPPPLSPEIPCSPTIEKTMELCSETFAASPIPGLITFQALIPKDAKRKYVAKLFCNILRLHANEIIYVQQPTSYGDIFLSPAQNFVVL